MKPRHGDTGNVGAKINVHDAEVFGRAVDHSLYLSHQLAISFFARIQHLELVTALAALLAVVMQKAIDAEWPQVTDANIKARLPHEARSRRIVHLAQQFADFSLKTDG